MCDKCVHGVAGVCKYKEYFEQFSQVKVPAALAEIVKVDIKCIPFKDERYYKVIRSMGAEV